MYFSPKTVNDGLVFHYDTGNTVRSYKGEPTTNLLPAGVAFGHNSGTYGNVVTVTDATSEKGPGWKKVTISNRGSNFRIIQWTYLSMSANIMYCHSAVFDWGNMRDKGYYINHDGNGTGQRFFYKPGDYVTNRGANISINSTLVDGKIAGNITHTDSHTHAFFINNNTTGVSGLNDYFYYKEFQVEANSHPTPYTAGTRSATQGLLDLTGRSTANLANVSFDANAQIRFDGTDDYVEVPDATYLRLTTDMSFEFVVYADSTQSNLYPRLIDKSNFLVHLSQTAPFSIAQNVNTSSGLRQVGVGSAFPANTWTHIATTYDGQVGKIYVNSKLVNTVNWGSVLGATTSGTSVRIGGDGFTSRPLNGLLPVTKVYNRALTSDEIRRNYNSLKSRFNL